MVFKKTLMLKRLEREGRMDSVTPEVEAIMDDLDGHRASAQCWARQVNDEPVLYVVGKSGKGRYVNEEDCV